jgi:hypothetical protein
MVFIGGKPLGMAGDPEDDASPLSPLHSIGLSVSDPWWRVRHLTNTHAYIVKRSSLQTITKLLRGKLTKGFKSAIDILYVCVEGFDD